jgi:hypothetical protein
VTRDEVWALPAGPELDALVAEKVMGWQNVQSADRLVWLGWPPGVPMVLNYPNGYSGAENIPPYSTDIAAAWQVVEKMERTPFVWRCPKPEEDRPQSGSGLTLRRAADGWTVAFQMRGRVGTGDTAPLAIVRAALFALFL